MSAYTEGSRVVPPDSDIVTPVSIRTPAVHCSMIEPNSTITESYGVVVGCTLVDTSNWSAKGLVINPGFDAVVLAPFSCVCSVVQVSAVTIAQDMLPQPEANLHGPFSPHLKDIVRGSHPSLGVEGRAELTDLLYTYKHVPVTGQTQAVWHEIETNKTTANPMLATSPCTSRTLKRTRVCQGHVGMGAD